MSIPHDYTDPSDSVAALVFNCTKSPLRIDASGRVLGGKEWGRVNPSNPFVQKGIDSGQLRVGKIFEVAIAPVAAETEPSKPRRGRKPKAAQ